MDAIAAAIADPIRREILALLREGPRGAGAIAKRFVVSRPAVSRHLRVLREAGLVVDEVRGRTREYRLCIQALAPLEAWLRALHRGRGWEPRFDALATEVHRVRAQKRSENRPSKRSKESA